MFGISPRNSLVYPKVSLESNTLSENAQATPSMDNVGKIQAIIFFALRKADLL